MRMARSLFLGLLTALIITGAFWVSGFDFDKRGEVAFGYYFLCVFVGFWVFGISMIDTSK
jgi:hypothetical protein